jgi:ribosome-binding factor A
VKIKNERINSELSKQITEIIANEVKDPRMGDAIVSVTKTSVTPDLRFAKVYLSVFSKNRDNIRTAFETVVRSRVFIRNRLKECVRMRLVPELDFRIDDSVDYGMKIEQILSKIDIPSQEE